MHTVGKEAEMIDVHQNLVLCKQFDRRLSPRVTKQAEEAAEIQARSSKSNIFMHYDKENFTTNSHKKIFQLFSTTLATVR